MITGTDQKNPLSDSSPVMRIPDDLPTDTLGAALAYIDAGIYVLPIDPRTKHAGSVLGKGWPEKSSKDPKVIASWFACSNRGLALHLGRSGLIAFDVDDPERLPSILRDMFVQIDPPFQSTRKGEAGRGHYPFRQPAFRCMGNSLGGLPVGWGDIRGKNGIIVVEPSLHSKAADGGQYRWTVDGPIPLLPDVIADLLSDAMDAGDAATDEEVQAFLDSHTEGSRPGRLAPIVRKYEAQVGSGCSRHTTLVGCLTWGCREVLAGHIDARQLHDRMLAVHTSALSNARHPNGADPGRHDFADALAWALSQARSDPHEGTMPTNPATGSTDNRSDKPQRSGVGPEARNSADSADAAADFIGEPRPLRRTPVPPCFPVEVLQQAVRQMVVEVAESTQTDEGMAGVVALGVLAAAAGGFAEVTVRPGYTEPLNLWVANVALPAERKSRVCGLMTAPLVEFEAELVARMMPRIVEQRTLKEIAGKIAGEDKRVAHKAESGMRDKSASTAVESSAQAASIVVPPVPQIIADDVTLEALGSRLAEQGGRLAIVSTEGGFLTTAAGRYSSAADLSIPLKAHAGDSFRVDRVLRPSEFVSKPALTLVMMVQPGILTAAATNPAFHNSGFLARFLFSYPPSRIGWRQVDPVPLNNATVTTYGAQIASVAASLRDAPEPLVLTLDPNADAVRLGYARQIEVKLGPDGELAHIRGWGGKLVGASVRIAGLLHLFEHGTDVGTISVESMRGGIALAEYFTGHALRTFDAMARGDDALGVARRVLTLISRDPTVAVFSSRNLFTVAPRTWMPDQKTMDRALKTLVDFGWIIPLPTPVRPEGKPGRPASSRYRAHAQCFGQDPGRCAGSALMRPAPADLGGTATR